MFHQAMSIEHGVHRADRRGLDIGVQPRQSLANFGSAPAGFFALEANDQFFNLQWQLIGLPAGAATAIAKRGDSAVLEPPVELVASLARDIEFATQNGHLLAVKQTRYKSKSFIHFVTLLPRHF